MAMKGSMLKAGDNQDQMAHIMAHLQFILSPIHQLDSAPNPALGNIMGHVREHLLLFYQQTAAHATAAVMTHVNTQQPQLPFEGGTLQ